MHVNFWCRNLVGGGGGGGWPWPPAPPPPPGSSVDVAVFLYPSAESADAWCYVITMHARARGEVIMLAGNIYVGR